MINSKQTIVAGLVALVIGAGAGYVVGSGAVTGGQKKAHPSTTEYNKAAVDKVNAGDTKQTIEETIKAKLKKLDVEVSSTKTIKGDLIEVQSGTDVFYATENGEYMLFGDLIDVSGDKPVNITKMKKAEMVFAEVTAGNAVSYKAEKQKYEITVFTDISCHYCQLLHQYVKEFNEAGVTVHYLAFPRAGMGSEQEKVMQQIWQSDKATDLLDVAMNKETLPTDIKADKKTPSVAKQYAIGLALHVEGTPTIVLSDGTIKVGAIKPAELLPELQAKFGK